MPLIDFPDVPLLPGVPDLARLPVAIGVRTGVTQFLQGLDYFSFLPSDVPQWFLFDEDGRTLVTPDSVVELGYRGEARVASYPVEQGSFASYNKVTMPNELTLRLSCGGKNMSRDAFLDTLESLKRSLTLVNVATPDAAYHSYNIDRLDYQRKSGSGVSMVIAEIHLVEVRVDAGASYSDTAEPSGNDPQSQGQVCTADNTANPTNQLTPLQKDLNSVKSAYQGAAQSLSKIASAVTTEATQVMSGVGKALETAGVGSIT